MEYMFFIALAVITAAGIYWSLAIYYHLTDIEKLNKGTEILVQNEVCTFVKIIGLIVVYRKNNGKLNYKHILRIKLFK